jgi:hypothetical protein
MGIVIHGFEMDVYWYSNCAISVTDNEIKIEILNFVMVTVVTQFSLISLVDWFATKYCDK